jgi:hypothetical protein
MMFYITVLQLLDITLYLDIPHKTNSTEANPRAGSYGLPRNMHTRSQRGIIKGKLEEGTIEDIFEGRPNRTLGKLVPGEPDRAALYDNISSSMRNWRIVLLRRANSLIMKISAIPRVIRLFCLSVQRSWTHVYMSSNNRTNIANIAPSNKMNPEDIIL